MTQQAGGSGAGEQGGGAPAGAAVDPGQGQAGAGAAPAVPAWMEGLPADLQSWVGEQKFNDLGAQITSHRNLLKLRGVPERELLRLQDKWEENPETAAQVYARLGRPEKPDEYEIPDIPIGDGDYNLANDFRAWAHEAGLSKRQANALAAKYQGTLQKFSETRTEAAELAAAEQATALKAEWGQEYDANVGAAKRAWGQIAQAVGMDAAELDRVESVLGHQKTMKWLALTGRTIGEHESIGGAREASQPFGLTPESALSRVAELEAQRRALPAEAVHERQRIGTEITRLRHVATGEAVPEYLKPR